MTSLLLEPAESGTARMLDGPAAAYRLFAGLSDAPRELAVFAYVDAAGTLLGLRHAPGEAVDSCAIPVRAVAGDALAFGACGLVMAHNHPSGDPTPSRGDREATRGLARALGPLGVRVIDHLVFARRGTTSFRALGWL
ncbi:JAB domain-containing protein [Stakelama tenebrarum]|uniref:DNA repair protein n=1 Tax=Stakelama tenebrarum TaxID=2711215 RepID=A0A6G6Y125_9SPHN|nr:JAB domain-containing protein [Sphingosinithalassobacter tenebrarum]QIG78418.1 DNA repair protein [Sphingosinithalassobacter tenebrarum]